MKSSTKKKLLVTLMLCLAVFSVPVSGGVVSYSKARKYHIRQSGCTYNKNISTMTALELNVPLAEDWPECQISNVKISGDEPFPLHNSEGPGQILRTRYENGLPKRGTIASVVVDYDIELKQTNINYKALANKSYPEYTKDDEYEYYMLVYEDIKPDDPLLRSLVQHLKRESGDNPVKYAKAVFDWVGKNIKYGPQPKGGIRKWLELKQGDCGAIAHIFVCLSRAGGVPARFVAGCWAGGFDGWHCWAEFRLPEGTWIPIDHSPSGGFGNLLNNHIPLVKACGMKFDTDRGSKKCGFMQVGYWGFWYAEGTEGNDIDTIFSVESFAYDEMPNTDTVIDIKMAFKEANKALKKKKYNHAIKIYRKILMSEMTDQIGFELVHFKLAQSFLGKGQRVKAALELKPFLKGKPESVEAKRAEKLMRKIRSQRLFLNDLQIETIHQDWGRPRRNKSVDGNPISIGGKKFKNGIGTHSNSTCIIDTNGSIDSFTAFVGVDDEVKKGDGSVDFIVIGDDKTLWQSGTMRSGDSPKKVYVATKGVERLVLQVTSADDGLNSDHADWGDAFVQISGVYPKMSRPK